MGFGGKKRRRQEETIETHTTFLWIILCVLVIAGAGISVGAMVLNTWRNGAAIQYRYIFRSNEKTVSVAETSYGLYTIVYDGGSSYISWPQRVQDSQTRGNVAIQMGQQSSSNSQFQAWASQCPPQCQDAISTRVSCYKRICTISTILLGALSLGGALGLIGAGWFFIFGKLAFLQMGCWLVAAALCFGCLGYWIWETDTCWRMVVASQQLPYPAVGLPWYLALISSALYVVAGLGSIVADYIDTFRDRKAKEQAQMRLMMEAGDAFDSFMGMPGGFMPGGPLARTPGAPVPMMGGMAMGAGGMMRSQVPGMMGPQSPALMPVPGIVGGGRPSIGGMPAMMRPGMGPPSGMMNFPGPAGTAGIMGSGMPRPPASMQVPSSGYLPRPGPRMF